LEKKGFTETLKSIEEAGVNVAGVSTDSHPQIKKYMREEQKDKKHHIDDGMPARMSRKKTVGILKKEGLWKVEPMGSLNHKSLLVEY